MKCVIVKKSNIRGMFSAPTIGNYGGDYSFAGAFLARAALDSSVICDNLNPGSQQNGMVVLNIIRKFGAQVKRGGDSVNVRAEKLKGCHLDISEFPQIAPITSLLAMFATGKTRVSGFKNSTDLQQLIIGNLHALGVRCEFNDNDLWIWPQKSPSHAVLDAKDHPYMAMALILISTYTKNDTVIRNIEGLIKRYPTFFETFSSLGGICEINDGDIIVF